MSDRFSFRLRRSTLSIALALTLAGSLLPLGTSAAAAGSASARRMRPPTPELIERAVRRGEITEARGALYLAWAFSAPHRVPQEYVSDTPWSGTLPLLELQRTLPELGDAPAAATARSALRAKTFACPGTTGSLPKKRSTKHFYIQYSTMKGATINQYAAALETTWKTEIGKFGWAKPPKDPVSYPKGGRYPVRIENLGPGLYGYVTGTRFAGNNPATPWNDRDAVASCMVLARNFKALSHDHVSPLDALRATAAHEFNHSIQFGYGALVGPGSASNVMIEALATWMEDEVFDSANDAYNYLWPNFTVPMGRYNPGFPYPYWVVFRAMAERYGTGVKNGSEKVYQTFWELVSKRKATNLKALGKAFKTSKNITLAQAFHDASIALRFSQDCSDPRYCLEEGPDYPLSGDGIDPHPGDHVTLGAADPPLSRKIANDLALNWIGIPDQNGIDVTVTHDGGKGVLKVSIACRNGNAVTVADSGTARSSSPEVELQDLVLGPCDEATAVISNVKVTSATPKKTTKTTYTIELLN